MGGTRGSHRGGPEHAEVAGAPGAGGGAGHGAGGEADRVASRADVGAIGGVRRACGGADGGAGGRNGLSIRVGEEGGDEYRQEDVVAIGHLGQLRPNNKSVSNLEMKEWE